MNGSRVIRAEIINNREIARGVFSMRLKPPDDYPCPAPGQFVCVYLNDESRLLPRPFSVCDREASGLLTLVYAVAGGGTKILSGYGSGTVIRVSTPMGNGFKTDGFRKCVLVGGGVGAAPLLYLSRKLAGTTQARAVLGFRNEPFLADAFHCAVDVATDDGSAGFRGTVLDLLKKTGIADDEYIFACGPKPMLRALARFAEGRGELWVSIEERMGCGYGACMGCVCDTKGGSRKVCEDGPVFDGCEVIWHD